MAGQGTPATALLTRRGVRHSVHPYRVPPETPQYGARVAAALGVPTGQVFKTLVTEVDGGLTVAVVPVTGELDLKALAAAVGGKRAGLADRVLAERVTGYVRGGISPLGQRRRLPTVLDSSALGFPTVYVSAGRRGLQVQLAPADLIALTGATTAPLATAPLATGPLATGPSPTAG
ncbi:Cys-tRNA(Pro) deacylase [Micromonospora sp. WMMD882]|uniref:Cys-tRNA(Pro) deacylase n=1 Tax=Micromonospora sp. WMMD882 TaxID=3015151 RepID=UPI00248B0600|nr:Cys-tRNA(Pro) deacylase [Micromonospora sp. WMMD882]WBB79232.1 Cys-tRNA(Pro) deacylase [Micromonospora sp. WMMD882]